MKHIPILMTLTSLLVLGGDPSSAAATEQSGASGPEFVPLVVPAAEGPNGYIIPNCRRCKKLSLERQTTANGGTLGVLGLTYYDDAGDFLGDIEVTVVLDDDSEHLVVLEGVRLENGQQAVWTIAAPSAWAWEDVSVAWLELVAD